MWRNHFGRGVGPVVRHYWMNECIHGMRLFMWEVQKLYRLTESRLPIKHHVVIRGAVQVQFHLFLTTALDRVVKFPPWPLPQKEPLLLNEREAGWDPGLALIFWRRERTPTPAANQTLDHSACSLVTILTTLFQLLGYTTPGAIPHVCLVLPTSIQLTWGFITQ
jgi:hypothetical protein